MNTPIKALVYMFLSVFFIASMNVSAKLLSQSLHVLEVAFYRNLIALILVALFIFTKYSKALFKTTSLKAQFWRALMGNASLCLVFFTYSQLAFADATAVLFMGPFFAIIISVIWLKEKVGLFRWGAVMLGFAGVLLIAQPGQGNINIGFLTGLSAALCTAIVMNMLRFLGKIDHPLTTAFYFLAIGTIILFPFAIIFGKFQFSDMAIAIIIAVGIFGALSQILKTIAYKLGEVSALQPLQYTNIIWSVIFGWLFWGSFPDALSWLGIVIVIGANLIIIWREKYLKKDMAPIPPI